MSNSTPSISFSNFTLSGEDCIKFLQGQITCNVDKLTDAYQATSICSIKGKVNFGLWIKKISNTLFEIVLSNDLAENFAIHIKKYGAFSKITLSNPKDIFPLVLDEEPTFSTDKTLSNPSLWAQISIATGNFWIVTKTQELFQPQELRLHQRGGVSYDKGCYLGQEVIARMYFKSSPRAFLHRIAGMGDTPKSGEGIGEKKRVMVVNAITSTSQKDFEALVVARPELLDEFEILDLPPALKESVARNG